MNHRYLFGRHVNRNILILALGVLILITALAVSRHDFTKQGSGTIFCEKETVLIINSNGNLFGKIISEDKQHVFPNGAVGGYYIAPYPGGSELWVISKTVDSFARKETRCVN